jgi:putative alpha-1,2-mannosidase
VSLTISLSGNILIWDKGLYPIVTQPVYLLLSPWFSDLSISVAGNKTLKITTTGLENGPYVQSVKINGVIWNKSWVIHEDLIGGDGGRIDFVLGSEQTEWDSGELPPSPGHLDFGVRN